MALLITTGGCTTTQPSPEVATGECVVLVHGLWRNAWAMQPLANSLRESGFHTVSIDYDSTGKALEAVANEEMAEAVRQCQTLTSGPVHLVTHSMGGLAARYYLATHALPPGGRVVMLAPPNDGSSVVSHFEGHPLLACLIGSAAAPLSESRPQRLPGATLTPPIGVIAGNNNPSPVPIPFLDSPNDSTVSVASTLLDGMDDFIVVPESHVSIRRSETVHRQIRAFLRQGRFEIDPATPP
ncbi:alpha/beta hydrolase family protein [Tamilnaduibacter salinus]|uniref:alpha/beta hydrolase family protein n=1 Tax=Tamilnaduibacter salinus TaxID=1484056 RepID=UPI00117D560E|nr:alpha/beta hydrolase family protein [Tamilnaduibacter salinus]